MMRTHRAAAPSGARRRARWLGRMLAAALLAACAAVPAAAQPVAGALPAEVDLPAVLRIAREASPRLAVEREAVAAAEARRIAAAARPNPRIGVAHARRAGGAPVFEARGQTDMSIEFPLLIAGQRGARIAAAERWIETARARVSAGENALAEEAGVAFVAVLAAEARVAHARQAIGRVERIVGIVAAREAAGLASRFDLARAEVERAALEVRLAEQLAERLDALGALAVLLGVPGWAPRPVGTLEPIAQGEVPARARADAVHPALEAARREETAAAATVEVARRERWPVPALGVGRLYTDSPYGAAHYIGLSVEVPIFDTRRGPFEEARAEARAAGLRRSLIEAQLGASLERYEALIAQRRAALEDYDREAGARLPALEQMAEDAYRFGRSTILEWLDATRTQFEQRLLRIDLLAGLAEARLRALGARGLLVADPGMRR
jgi:cobalt-zinc-cadmium efflux system outer membrane protein